MLLGTPQQHLRRPKHKGLVALGHWGSCSVFTCGAGRGWDRMSPSHRQS